MDPILQARGDVNPSSFGCLLALYVAAMVGGSQLAKSRQAVGSSVSRQTFGGMDGWPHGPSACSLALLSIPPSGRPKALLE